ncbi:MAG: hypothetical protein D6693_10285 [Planctomycetota bacterium]|nr:MAG: hypothetical protein D6693_10285 [Planctomycetota bacterium]
MAGTRAQLGAVGGLIAVLAGCAGLGVTPPETRIAGLRHVETTPDGALYEITVEGANRTGKDLRLESVRYWMTLDGRRVFQATRSPQATFSALDARSFSEPIAVPAAALPADPASARYEVGAVIVYRVPGPLARTLFELGVSRPRVRARSAGVGLPGAGPTP